MQIQELPDSPTTVQPVESAAKQVQGLDLLGLRAPAEAVALTLMDGVTTITPLIRYFAVRAWIIKRYLDLKGMYNWKTFSAFAGKVEAAFACASVLNRDETGVVGRDRAATEMETGSPTLSLRSLTRILATNIYGGPSEALGFGSTEGEVPSLTPERGLPLAEAFARQIPVDSVLLKINSTADEHLTTREELKQLGAILSFTTPPVSERELLHGAIIPVNPRPQEVTRIATYCLLLHLVSQLGHAPSEDEIFDAVSQFSLAEVPAELHFVCDGWTRFVVRDLMVQVHETAVHHALIIVHAAPNPEKRLQYRDVIADLVSGDLDTILNSLGLADVRADDPISKLYASVIQRCGHEVISNGLRRWDGPLREVTILGDKRWAAEPAGVAVLPVVWILGYQRVEPGLHSPNEAFNLDARAGLARIGVSDVIRPNVIEWKNSERTVREIVGWMIQRSVEQHLRIAWSRLAREPNKDVALLHTDGDEWIAIKQIRHGRATSRLYRAVNWLTQLGLVDDNSITERGQEALAQGLMTIRPHQGNGA